MTQPTRETPGQTPGQEEGRQGCTRRHLLVGMAASGALALLAGCGVASTAPPPPDIAAFPTLRPALPSPQPLSGSQAAAATPRPGGLELASFLALSSLLTGIDDLNPQIGAVYLESLEGSDQFALSLADLHAQMGFGEASAPPSLEEAAGRGVFDAEASRTLADKVIEYWYSGVYETADGGQAVATFADALVWRAVGYTKPLTLCGAPGFWALVPANVETEE